MTHYKTIEDFLIRAGDYGALADEAETALTALRELQAQQATSAQGEAVDIEALCARIKAADDASADMDYMLDSDDCISVLRGTWRGPMLNDMPTHPQATQPAQQAQKQEPVNQWRHKGASDWYDGHPDYSDGGSYEVRILYTGPQRELVRKLYVELFHVSQQLCSVLDEDGEPIAYEGKSVTEALAEGKAWLEANP